MKSKRGGAAGWWGKMVGRFKGEEGVWLWGNLRRIIGNGLDTSFWNDCWQGPMTLKARFPLLFQLSADKKCSVGEAGCWEEGRWVWKIGWRRRLFDREKVMEREFVETLNMVEIKAGVSDEWSWVGSDNSIYSVKLAYDCLSRSLLDTESTRGEMSVFNLIWKATAPLKAQAMAWRLLWDRLPTKDNLEKRRLIPSSELACCSCRLAIELAAHLFLSCSGAQRIWNAIIKWINWCLLGAA